MQHFKNVIVKQSHKKPLWVDVFLPENADNAPAILFLPGFKAFKDWGFFPHMHKQFNISGIALITVNFSHNGVTPETPQGFSDLEAFAQNTISLELEEIKAVMDWLTEKAPEFGIDATSISLMGHSRGGGEAIVCASTDERFQKVVAWAPVSDFAGMFKNEDVKAWKTTGRISITNARTKQQMPMDYSFYEDLQSHKNEFDVLKCAENMSLPLLLVHGLADESVPFFHSEKIYNQCLHAILVPIPDATHTFNSAHPFSADQPWPAQLQQLIDNTIEFILD